MHKRVPHKRDSSPFPQVIIPPICDSDSKTIDLPARSRFGEGRPVSELLSSHIFDRIP